MSKKQLTTEEKMNNALVPEEEWPYKLPDNWCWVRLENVAQWGSGGTPSRKVPEFYVGNIPWIKTGELTEGYIYDTEEHISDEAVKKSGAKIFPVNTVVIAMYGATIGKVGIMGVPATTNQACACAVCTDSVDYNFLAQYLQSQRDVFIAKGQGGAQPNISQQIIKKHLIPLPPIYEQQRIVSRIESLFAKLDEAKEKIQNVLDGAENRKAAILHQAFTGKLTAKWRKENGVMDDSWEEVTIKSLCNSLKYGTAKKSAKEGKVPVLRMGNLQNGEIDWTSLVYSNDSDDIRKYSLQNEDVLFNRTNSAELVGKTSIYRGQQPAIYAGYLIKLDYKRDRILGDYLNYVLNSPSAKEYCNAVKTDGVNQSNINAQKIGAFGVRLPKLSEQKEIVRRLDNFLNKEKSICKSCEASLAAIEAMKKAILAKAFRGELGTNNPAEESAKELLKKCLTTVV